MSDSQKDENGKIASLTPEQEAKIPAYVEEYVKVGLNTEPCDRPAAEDAIKRLYKFLKKDEPEFVWFDSPYPAARRVAAEVYGVKEEEITSQQIWDQAGMASYGSFESYWVALYDFINKELPVDPHELYGIAVDITKTCGIYWTMDGLAVMSDRPKAIHLDNNLLHNTEGPAIEYRDGRGIFAYKGDQKASLIEVKMAALK